MARASYYALLACYISGQMTERQWQEHLAADEVFAAWARRLVTPPAVRAIRPAGRRLDT